MWERVGTLTAAQNCCRSGQLDAGAWTVSIWQALRLALSEVIFNIPPNEVLRNSRSSMVIYTCIHQCIQLRNHHSHRHGWSTCHVLFCDLTDEQCSGSLEIRPWMSGCWVAWFSFCLFLLCLHKDENACVSMVSWWTATVIGNNCWMNCSGYHWKLTEGSVWFWGYILSEYWPVPQLPVLQTGLGTNHLPFLTSLFSEFTEIKPCHSNFHELILRLKWGFGNNWSDFPEAEGTPRF